MNDVVHGHCDSRFSKVADALAGEIAKGEELGASIALDIDGELVVDIWGGHADRAKTTAWGEDTIVNFFSCTKTLTALAALIATIKKTGAKVIIMEPYYDRKMADFVAKNTGARVLVLPSSVGGVKGVDSYVRLISHNLSQLAAAVK